jgi:DNA-binding transcriptional ArsR family regulator
MTAIFKSRELAADVSERLRVYAQPQRLMILSYLLRGERTVADIGEAAGITQPALSQQLAELRRADLVITRKEAKQVWYSLANDGVRLCVETMEAIFCGTQPPVVPHPVPSPALAEKPMAGVASFARVISPS